MTDLLLMVYMEVGWEKYFGLFMLHFRTDIIAPVLAVIYDGARLFDSPVWINRDIKWSPSAAGKGNETVIGFIEKVI